MYKGNGHFEFCVWTLVIPLIFSMFISSTKSFLVPCGRVYNLGSKLTKVPKPSSAPWVWHFGTSLFLIWTEFVAKNWSHPQSWKNNLVQPDFSLFKDQKRNRWKHSMSGGFSVHLRHVSPKFPVSSLELKWNAKDTLGRIQSKIIFQPCW